MTYNYDAYVPTNWDVLDLETRYQWLRKYGLANVASAYQDAVWGLIDAMRHDLETSQGLWCVDHEPKGVDAFQLKHKSLDGETNTPDWSGYHWIHGE